MDEKTRSSRSVVVQKMKIDNYGEFRYKMANALVNTTGYDLTTEFQNAVTLLPLDYSISEYAQFLDDWGTVSNLKIAH